MAAAPLGLPPVRLNWEKPGYYRDENQRIWKVLSLQFTPDHPTHSNPDDRLSVRLLQVGECCLGHPPPMFSCLDCLPMTWKNLSLELYSGSDARLWIIVEHDWLGDREQLELEMGNKIGRGIHSFPRRMHTR
ncbi:protein TCL1B2-like [Mesocricetus auratus]|uniref:Protein TCL1B2-like n=1 Tax=Mesocricetus auratus TaxID=10036 RepID=A0ABM2X8W4_MESAU|nr:protein TCL1B2-like [Mesocricetus auratus]